MGPRKEALKCLPLGSCGVLRHVGVRAVELLPSWCAVCSAVGKVGVFFSIWGASAIKTPLGAAFARQHPDGKAVRGVHPRYGHATVTAPYCPLPTHSLGTPKTYRKRAWFWDREGPKLVPRGRRRTGHPDPLQQAGAAVPVGRGAVPKPHRGPFPPGVHTAQRLLQICLQEERFLILTFLNPISSNPDKLS